jgi:hypothetical protein
VLFRPTTGTYRDNGGGGGGGNGGGGVANSAAAAAAALRVTAAPIFLSQHMPGAPRPPVSLQGGLPLMLPHTHYAQSATSSPYATNPQLSPMLTSQDGAAANHAAASQHLSNMSAAAAAAGLVFPQYHDVNAAYAATLTPPLLDYNGSLDPSNAGAMNKLRQLNNLRQHPYPRVSLSWKLGFSSTFFLSFFLFFFLSFLSFFLPFFLSFFLSFLIFHEENKRERSRCTWPRCVCSNFDQHSICFSLFFFPFFSFFSYFTVS